MKKYLPKMEKGVSKKNRKYKVYTWTPPKGQSIDKESVKQVYAKMKDKFKGAKLVAWADLGGRIKTISKENEMNLKEEEEYYEGKVKDVDKLTEIEELKIFVYE